MGKYEVAKAIKRIEPARIKEIAEEVGKPPSSISPIIQRLSKGGYLKREYDGKYPFYSIKEMPERRYTVQEIKDMRDD